MTRKEAKANMIKLDTLVENSLDKYLDNIYKIIIKYFDNKISKNKAIKEIFDLIYQALEDVYKITSKKIKEDYKRIAPFKIKDVLDLTYQADGKVLKERISDYFQEQNLNKLQLFSKILKLLVNESKIVQSNVVKGKLRRVASMLVIECNGDDCNSECLDYAGEYPANEDIPLPPYHPDCICSYYYIETDDDDDIDDLGLEIEDIIIKE